MTTDEKRQERQKYYDDLHELFRNRVQNLTSGQLAIYTRDAQETLATIKSDSFIISEITKIVLEEATEECIKRIESAGEIENMLTEETEKKLNDTLKEIEETYKRILEQDITEI